MFLVILRHRSDFFLSNFKQFEFITETDCGISGGNWMLCNMKFSFNFQVLVRGVCLPACLPACLPVIFLLIEML